MYDSCGRHLDEHCQRMPFGKLVVGLSFRNPPSYLGNSSKGALKRFSSIKIQLSKAYIAMFIFLSSYPNYLFEIFIFDNRIIVSFWTWRHFSRHQYENFLSLAVNWSQSMAILDKLRQVVATKCFKTKRQKYVFIGKTVYQWRAIHRFCGCGASLKFRTFRVFS